MRISDWSSDVCSSDLLVMHVITGLGVGGAEAVLTSILLRDRELQIQPVVVSLLPGGRMAEKLRQAGVSVIELNAKYDAQGLRALEIGRASCRERVCQYV